MLDRPALARRLAGVLDRGTLMLVGPAGGGRTSALEAATARRGGAVAWVGCEPADADPGRLLARIVGAIQVAAPGAADPLAAALAAATEPVSARAAARVLARDLAERLSAPLVLVLDDAPPEAAEVIAVLQAPRLRLAIAAEAPLDVPAERIGTGELVFSREECFALAGAQGDAVHAATGGWPLGVAIAAGTGRPARPGDALGDHLGGLLAPLGPELAAALVDASAAAEIDAAVLQALQPPDGFLDALRHSGVPLRERGGVIVVHPLVRAALGRLLVRERPSEYRELLHARIAAALDKAGRGAEAVEHWLEVPEEAPAAVARHGEAVVDTAPATAARWLRRIDGPVRQAPELQLLAGRLALGEGRLLDAPGPLRDAVIGFEARADEASAWGARLALADALGMLERFEAAIPLAAGFERSRAPAAPMVAITAAAALAGTGAFDEAVALFERASSRAAVFAPFAAAFRASWVDLQLGELDAALTRARGAADALRRDDPFRRLAHVLVIEAAILEDRGEDAAALAVVAEARGLAERTAPGGTVEDLGGRFAAGVLARSGRADEAEAELAALEGHGAGWYAGDVHVTRAAIAATRGDHDLAAEEARRAIDAGALRVWRTRARTVAALAPVLAAAARDLVEAALAEAPPRVSVARLLALRAWLRALDGDAGGAASGVAEAFAAAGDAAPHLLRRERPRLEPLLAGAVERGALAPEVVAETVRASRARSAAPRPARPAGAARRRQR